MFAITQVTSLLADDPTWGGVLRGMLVLAALWWAWTGYAWLTSAMDVDEGGVRLAMLAAMGAMLVVGLAVPGAFGDDAVLFGVAYLLVRLLHLVLSAIVGRDDPDRRGALLRFAPTALLGASLLVVAGFLEGDERVAVWVVALAIDYLGPVVIGVGRGWRVAPEHFAERHGLIILIALGESIIAIGVGAGLELGYGSDRGGRARNRRRLGALVALLRRGRDLRPEAAHAGERRRAARLALDAYSYLHLPMVAGIVLFAFGLETTLDHVGERARHGARSRALRRRRAVPARARRVPLPNDRPGLPAADDRGGRVARPHPGRSRDPGARGARPRQRRVLARRGVRGDPPSRAPESWSGTPSSRNDIRATTSLARMMSSDPARTAPSGKLKGFANIVFPDHDLNRDGRLDTDAGPEPAIVGDVGAIFSGDGVEVGMAALPKVEPSLVSGRSTTSRSPSRLAARGASRSGVVG